MKVAFSGWTTIERLGEVCSTALESNGQTSRGITKHFANQHTKPSQKKVFAVRYHFNFTSLSKI